MTFVISNDVKNISDWKKPTVPAPMKDAASIWKLFFQPCTIVFIYNTHLHKVQYDAPIFYIFKVRLLLKSVFYWRGYGILIYLDLVGKDADFPEHPGDKQDDQNSFIITTSGHKWVTHVRIQIFNM